MSQKLFNRTYSGLKGKKLECFIGRLECEFKHIALEVSTERKENVFGVYVPIVPQITRTHFNGKVLELEVRHLNNYYGLKIPENEIANLTLHI